MLLRFTSVLLFSILFSVKASAIERCDCTVSQFRDAGDFRDYMHEVAIFGKVEHRKTVTEFATATGQDPNVVDQKYSATGDLSCAGKGGTAQVTIKNNLITTSAHALFNPKTCVPIASPSGCTFTLKNIKGDVQKIKVKELLATGIK
ncbi:MAG: hypothetical protein ACXVA9_04685, partial [Bdellovibrionales bacterium]